MVERNTPCLHRKRHSASNISGKFSGFTFDRLSWQAGPNPGINPTTFAYQADHCGYQLCLPFGTSILNACRYLFIRRDLLIRLGDHGRTEELLPQIQALNRCHVCSLATYGILSLGEPWVQRSWIGYDVRKSGLTSNYPTIGVRSMSWLLTSQNCT